MAFIKTIPPRKATGETARAYDYMIKMGGSGVIPKIIQAFSLRPEAMRRMIRTWELAAWTGEEPRHQKELVGSAVSRLNGCVY